MKKRILALLLVFAMVLSATPSYAIAAEEDSTVSVGTAEDLAAALAAGGQVTLLSSIELSQTLTVPAGTIVTLDLAGYTVSMNHSETVTANHEMILNKGNLTIQNTKGDGKLSYQYTGANVGTSYGLNTITSEPGSVLSVKSGTIENLTYDSGTIAYAIDGRTNGGAGDVTVNISGGIITSQRQAIRIFANSTSHTGTLNISGGNITGRVIVQNANASANKAALNITGGIFNANSYKTDVLSVGGSNGATIAMTPVISGGIFNGEITSQMSGGFITGGTFTESAKNNTNAALISADCKFFDNEDNTYSVSLINKVAEINGTYYKSLQAAFDDAQKDDVVTLCTDVELDATLTVAAGKTVTLDLAGHTISGVCNASQASMIIVSNTATLTIKDSSDPSTGKITYGTGTANVGFALDVKGNLILESGTIELTGSWSLGFAVDVRPNAWGTAYTESTTFVMNGGKVVSSDTAVRVDSNSSNNYEKLGVYFTMNGGVIESDWDAVFIQHRYANYLYVTINDGNISGKNSPLRIYGDSVVSDVYVELKGGTFDYTGEAGGAWIVENFLKGTASVVDAAEITITGGHYENMDAKYVAAGYSAVKVDDYYIVHMHDSLTDIPAVDATCTETGLTAGKKCSICGTVMSGVTEIPASEHSWSTDFQPGTDTHWQYCNNNCGTKQNEAAHTFVEKIDNVYIVADSVNDCAVEYVKSCSVCGKGHATETFWAKKEAPEHTYNAGLVTTEPTCTTPGVKTYACINEHCGHTKTETIPANGHTEVEISGKDATCTETGLTAGKKCSTCGTVTVAQIVVGKKAHTEVDLPAKEATCTETGLTAGKKCSTCGTTTVAQTVVAAKGHTLQKVPAVAATYFAPGNIAYYTCSVCDALFADAEGAKEVTLADVTLAQLVKIEDTTADVSNDVVEDIIKEATNSGTTNIVITVTQDKLADDNKEDTSAPAPDEDDSTDTPEPPATEPAPVVTKTQLPVAAVQQVADLHEEATLTVSMTNAAVTLDKTTLDVVTEKAKTEQTDVIALEIEHIKTESLAPAQQVAVEEKTVAAVISASILVNDKEVHDFEGGKVTVTIPFTLEEGTTASDYVVLYIADDGTIEEIPSTVADGKLVMTLSHFSEYVVVNTAAPKDPTNPGTGDSFNPAVMIFLMVSSATAIIVLSNKKRFVK